MPRESLGYVKLEWTCPKCSGRNPGPEKTCLSCGAPQPQDVQFEQAVSQELIKDKEDLAKARSDPDIHCAFCGTRNPATAEICSQCGADLVEGVRRESGRVVGAFKTGPVKQIPCPNCGQGNPETTLKCAHCGATIGRTPQQTLKPDARPAGASSISKSKTNPLVIGLFGVLGVICILAVVVFIILSLRTEGQNAVVQNVGWTTTVVIEGLVPVDLSNWRSEIPENATIGTCVEKIHHIQDEPALNANKVCGTPYTVDKGSGFAEVVQDCHYEVLEEYCEYTSLEWRQVDQLSLHGSDYSPVWAKPQLANDQRLAEKTQSFTVIFATQEGPITYTTQDERLYQQLQIGSEWILNINSFGNVISIEPGS